MQGHQLYDHAKLEIIFISYINIKSWLTALFQFNCLRSLSKVHVDLTISVKYLKHFTREKKLKQLILARMSSATPTLQSRTMGHFQPLVHQRERVYGQGFFNESISQKYTLDSGRADGPFPDGCVEEGLFSELEAAVKH